jgi:hydrogenase-4 component B
VSGVLERATTTWAPELAGVVAPVANLAPLTWLSITGVALLLLTCGLGAVFLRVYRPARAPATVTWDCGYAAPTTRMQYTSSSFADTLVRLFSWALWPFGHDVRLIGVFPGRARFHSHVPDTVLDRAVLPAARHVGRVLVWFRWVQHGNVHLYVLYVVGWLILTILLLRH